MGEDRMDGGGLNVSCRVMKSHLSVYAFIYGSVHIDLGPTASGGLRVLSMYDALRGKFSQPMLSYS